MIFRRPTHDELRFELTTSALKKYAKRIGLDLMGENKKPIIFKIIADHIKSSNRSQK